MTENDNEQELAEFLEQLDQGVEAKRNERALTRKSESIKVSEPQDQEEYLLNQITELIARNKKTLEQFEDRVDSGDVYEGTVQGLGVTMSELNKSLDQFVKLKMHREKLEHASRENDKKLEHQRRENDKKLMSKGFEIGEDGKMVAGTGETVNNYFLTGNPAEVANSDFFQNLVERVKGELPVPLKLKPEPVPIDAEIVV